MGGRMKLTCIVWLIHKMTEFQPWCLLLMVLSGLSLVTGNIPKSGCRGASVELYSNISLNSDDIVVSLYKNGQHNKMIAMWSKQHSGFKENFDKGYSKKVSLDKHGTLFIRNLDISDEGNYTIKLILGSWSTTYEVKLVVLDPPPTNCKPNITYLDKVLTASLKIRNCGNPAASVYWLDHPGLSNKRGRRTERNRQLEMTDHGKRKKVAYLQSGNEVGTYYACIKSPSLRCAVSPKPTDFCTAFTVDKNKIRSSLSWLSEVTTGTSTLHSTLGGPSAVPTVTSETQANLSGLIQIGILSAILLIFIVIVLVMVKMVTIFLRVKKKLIVKDEEAEKARTSTEHDASKALIGKEGPGPSTSGTLPGEVNTPSSHYVSIGFTRLKSSDSSDRDESQLHENIIYSPDTSEVTSEGNYDDNSQTQNKGSPYMNIPSTRTNSKDSPNKYESQNLQEGTIESTDVSEVESER